MPLKISWPLRAGPSTKPTVMLQVSADTSGDEEIEYDGEMHTAANLFDALKEGYYGKL